MLFWRLDRSLNGRADAAAKREVNEMATLVNGFSRMGINRGRYDDEGYDGPVERVGYFTLL